MLTYHKYFLHYEEGKTLPPVSPGANHFSEKLFNAQGNGNYIYLKKKKKKKKKTKTTTKNRSNIITKSPRAAI